MGLEKGVPEENKFCAGGPFYADITYLMTDLAERQRSMPSHAVAQERGGGYMEGFARVHNHSKAVQIVSM